MKTPTPRDKKSVKSDDDSARDALGAAFDNLMTRYPPMVGGAPTESLPDDREALAEEVASLRARLRAAVELAAERKRTIDVLTSALNALEAVRASAEVVQSPTAARNSITDRVTRLIKRIEPR